MPYVRKNQKTYKKKTYKRSSAVTAKRVYQIAKRVALKQCETKHVLTNWNSGGVTPIQDNAWVQYIAGSGNMLQCVRGIEDDTVVSRIGDEVRPVGLKIYLRYEMLANIPTQTVKLWLVKVPRGQSAATKAISGVYIQQPIDTETCKPIMMKTFRLVNSAHTATAPLSVFKTYWINLRSWPIYKYRQNTTEGVEYNIHLYMTAYHNQLVATQIGECEISSEFFFKDP